MSKIGTTQSPCSTNNVEVRGSPMRGYFILGCDGTGAWCLGKKYVSFAHSAAAGKALRQVQCASPGVQHRASFCLQGLRHGVICIAPRSSLFPLGEGRAAEGRPEQEGKNKKGVWGVADTKSVPEIYINDHEWGPHGSPRAHIRSE